VPTIISQALMRPSLRLGSLEPRRDLTYVKDTVSGFVAIAGCDAALGRAVNIGRGDDLTIGELVERIGVRLGRTLRVESDAARRRPARSEVGRLLAGTELARELWGWSPRYTLDQALDETIAYVREHIESFRVDEYTT
jgi:dTDP-glucose 4,6-dehydratase